MIVYPHVTAVILNTNKRQDTLACLESLHENNYPAMHIIVLDNHSTDGSVESIREAFPSVQIIQLNKNLGYAGNNNVGISAAMKTKTDWIFVLNEDIILAPDSIKKMMEAAHLNPGVGIVGPMVYHFDEPDIIQTAGGFFDGKWNAYHRAQNEKDMGRFSKPETVDWISGCAIGVRKEAIQQAGEIDERFFYYWEETEWCYRIRQHGFQALFVPEAKIWHKGVQRAYKPGPNITYYATRNRLLFYKKHRAPLAAWINVISFISRTLLSWTIKSKWRDMREHRDAMWQGTRDFLRKRWGIRTI